MTRHRAAAPEIAAALGISKQAVMKRAAREGWRYEEATTRGGRKRLYLIAGLPASVQSVLAGNFLPVASADSLTSLAKQIPSDAPAFSSRGPGGAVASSAAAESGSTPDPRSETLAALFDSRPEAAKAKARARLEVVNAYYSLLSQGFKCRAALSGVARERQVAEATLSRWLADVRGKPQHLWLQLLCPAHVGRVAEAEISAEAWETLKADYLRPEKPSASACIRRLQRVAGARGWTLPAPRTLLRRLRDLPRSIVVMRRDGMKAAKALYPPQIRDKSALHAMQIVNGDGYRHNVWVRDRHGDVYRPMTWFWQDVYSSKILAWCTAPTEHTEQIQLAFGDLCERFGIPHAATIDNTLAAANKTMSGGMKHRFRFKVREEEPDGVFKLLGVDVHWATPGHGQAKPIERAFGIGGAGEVIDKAPELAGAWAGAGPKEKPEYDGREKAVALEVLEEVIRREVESLNAMPGRRGAMHNGRSFDQVFNDSYASIEKRHVTEAQRRLWLLSTEPVRANTRDGSITLDAGRVRGERQANRYWHPQLIDHGGAQLVAKFDPRRLHQGVHIYSLDGRWICFAECDRPAGFNDASAGKERNRARNQFLRATKEIANAEVRMSVLDAAKSLQLAPSAGTAGGTIPAPKVVRANFADVLQRPAFVPVERSPEERAELAALEAEALKPAPVNVVEMRSDADRHTYWKSLDARRRAGEQLADHEEAFWQHWQTEGYFVDMTAAEAEFEQSLAARRA